MVELVLVPVPRLVSEALLTVNSLVKVPEFD